MIMSDEGVKTFAIYHVNSNISHHAKEYIISLKLFIPYLQD